MSQTVWYTFMDSPLGPLCLAATPQGLVRVDFQHGVRPLHPAPTWQEDAGRLTDVQRQLQEYFQGQRPTFTLPLAPMGTTFQQHVWQELQRIPYGTTITYLELARRLGKPRAVRAVGQANGCNPIAIIIPCHRVVGHDGRLRGYASGLPFKQHLLRHEGVQLV